MHIASVIPIGRGIPFDVLTYYSSEPLAPGTLVLIPFKREQLYGFVTETVPLAEAKTFVKKATFSLKKIKGVIGANTLFASIALAVKETGAATLAPVGAVAGVVIPEMLFEYIAPEKLPITFFGGTAEYTIQTNREKVVFGPRDERIDEYKRMIRSSFAAKKSVLFIAPTIKDLEWWKERLERGIARHVSIFHSKVSKKNLRQSFASLKQTAIPLLVFATPSFSALPIQLLGTIIAEDESSALYKSNDRYAIDTRIFLRRFAPLVGSVLVWGDTLPRFETLYRTDMTHLPRTYQPDGLHIVPIEHYRTTLPSEVIELIRHAEKKKRRLFLYTNRKGVAPLSRCSDCGTIVTCEHCGLPMALRHRVVAGIRERYFVCLHCAATLPSTHVCSYCGSWNITPLSIGTESLYDAVVSLVGSDSVIAIDDDLTPDSKTIDALINTIDSKKFAIIIGTQKALPYVKKIHYSIIAFFDRLLSTPSLYTTEQTLRLIMECNEFSSEGVIVCTKVPDFPFTRDLGMQKINAIIEDELALRKQLGYPPFGSLLKISLTVPDGYRKEVSDRMNEYFSNNDATALPARRINAASMKVLLSWLVKVESEYIEEEGPTLVQFLSTLRYPYKIEENPERL
ncbi:MAG TPA: hypothetical protein VG982_02780 [Candidatus Paceibacterota bacterium]|nr:hypothetical protein [Candidatus Paceibacterota bacterium]